MRLITFTVLLILMSFLASAAEVSRCVASDGHLTFTSGKCPEGTKLTATTSYTPEQVSNPRTWESEYEKQQRIFQGDDGSSYSRGYRSSASRSRTWRDHCRDVRVRIAREQEALGLKRTYSDIRRWNDEEYEACRGRNAGR